LAAKSGEVLTVSTPAFWRCSNLGAKSEAVQRVANDGEVVPARLGDDEALALAVEELDAKLRLERLDLVADRALRDRKLLGSAREAFMPRRSLEDFQGIQWR
jgi:hypothetical protein